jgi:hypothetical protein
MTREGTRSGQAGYARLAEWPSASSSLQFRAKLDGLADGSAHPPFRPFGTARCPGKRSELPSPAQLLGLCQHLAVPFFDQLVGPVGR